MFHVHAIHLTFGVDERKLAKRLDVLVKMEPNNKSKNFLLQIISYEKNAGITIILSRVILLLDYDRCLVYILQVIYMNSGDKYYVFLILMDHLPSASGYLYPKRRTMNTLSVWFLVD